MSAASAIKAGDVVRWLEDHSDAESGPEPPVECEGPVLACDATHVIVQSHWDGADLRLRRDQVTLAEVA